MVPAKTHEKWRALVTGELNHSFKSVPAALMFSGFKREARRDGSPENIKRLIEKAYAFFVKYEGMLAGDIRAIFK